MSANGLNSEDSEMAEYEGDKVVTMMDVLQEQQEFEDDANAVLGASDEKNCTYSKGYIKRQAIYACLTCCAEAKFDPSKRAGVCLACSLTCHEDHELIELYTKRNFCCDCGNPKFNNHPCQFTSNKTELNEENCYNQNFSGVYCVCHKPYPDPDTTVEDEMIQCIICEDWLHSSHLEATVPGADLYSEMICKACMEKNAFLHDYSHVAVKSESVDIDVTSIDESTVDSSVCNGDSVIESSTAADDSSLINSVNNHATPTTNGNIEKPMEPIIMSVEGNIAMNEQNVSNATDIEMPFVNKETINEDLSTDPKGKDDLSKEVLKDEFVDTGIVSCLTETTDENPSQEVTKDENIDAEPVSVKSPHNTQGIYDNNKDLGTKPDNNIETQTSESCNKEKSVSNDNKPEDNNEHQPDEILKENENASSTSSVEDPKHKNANSGAQFDKDQPSLTENESETNGISKNEETQNDSIIPGETNDKEQKRKLSTEDADEGIIKRPKLDEASDCMRPKGVKKVFKGATFWPSSFRQKLCTCNNCLSMYKDLSVLFLTELEDTVSAYELLGKERVEGTPQTQYEKGLEALSSLDRVQQINALTEYNNMRDKLLDFLKSFKDKKEVVKEEDIKEFFAGMKPKRESDGVYFCR